MSTGQFSKAVVVDDKTQKRRYIYVFGTWIVILNFISGWLLNFAQDVIRPWLLSAFWEGRLYTSLAFKGLK